MKLQGLCRTSCSFLYLQALESRINQDRQELSMHWEGHFTLARAPAVSGASTMYPVGLG